MASSLITSFPGGIWGDASSGVALKCRKYPGISSRSGIGDLSFLYGPFCMADLLCQEERKGDIPGTESLFNASVFFQA